MSLLDEVKKARRSQGSLLDKVRSARQAQATQEPVFTTPDGGQVFRGSDGALSYRDSAYATNDPAQIDRILQGATGGEVSISSFDRQAIEQAPIASRAVKAVEGVPFVGSYADEAAGAMFGGDAKQGVRAASGAMDREKPGQSTALNLSGTVASSVPLAMAAAPLAAGRMATTRGAQALQGIVAGGVGGGIEGAIYGSGEGEGEKRLQNATEQATFGTMIGGVLGGAAPFAVDAIKGALRKMRGSDVQAIQKTLGVGPEAAVLVQRALKANDLDAAITAIQRGGDNAMLADSGVAAQQLLDAAANASGKAAQVTRDAVGGRISEATAQFNRALDTTLGKPSGVKAMSKGVRDKTADARGSSYEAAYAKPINYAGEGGRRIEGILGRIPGAAIRDANALMKAEGVESAQILAEIADDGSVAFTRLPDVRQIDYITRALNGVADKADGQGKLGGQTPLGNAYRGLARTLRQTLRKEVPEYGRALDTAADAISEVKAGEAGYKLLRAGTTRETIKEALQGASKSERAAMAQGVRTYIDDTLANVTEILTDPNGETREALKGLKDLSSRAAREKLTMLLGQKKARYFFKELDEARTAFELRAAIHANSKTNIRGNIQDAAREVTGSGMLEVLADGQPVEASRRLIQAMTGSSAEAKALREAGVFEEIARVLTQTRGAEAQRALKIVQKAIDGQTIKSAQASYIAKVITNSAALTIHQQGKQRLSTR